MKPLSSVLSVIYIMIWFILPANAQPWNVTTTTGGTNNYIPKFTGLTSIENSSALFSSYYLQASGLKSSYTFPNLYLYETDTSKSWYIGVTASELKIWDTSTVRFTIEPGGEVGIGTENPTVKLDVVGTGRFTDTLYVEDISGGGWAHFDENITLNGDIDGGGTIEIDDNNATKGTAGDWLGSSDQRLKRNVRPITGALDVITSLRGVEYEWINPEEHGVQTDAGFIAQDVEQIFPNWVGEVEPDGADRNLIPQGEKAKGIGLPIAFEAYTVEAFRELSMEILALKEIVCADHPGAEICSQ